MRSTPMVTIGISNNLYRADQEYKKGPIHHDNAAVMIVDRELVAAIEEERLDRMKHSNAFPAQAINACLDIAEVGWSDIGAVAVSVAEDVADAGALYRFLVENPASSSRDARGEFAEVFRRTFGVDIRSRLRFCHHHLAHAWSAYGLSGRERQLISVFDGEGDNLSVSIWMGDAGRLVRLDAQDHTKSLGSFYINVIRLLGYTMFDEYKVMGLAPYGVADRYWHVFRECFALHENGAYEITPIMQQIHLFGNEGLIAKARRSGEPFTQEHKDIAAGLQRAIECMILHSLRHYHRVTGARSLALTGGVAQNCTINGRILADGIFDDVFIPPAAHDAGTALGAALCVAAAQDSAWTSVRMQHSFLGRHIGTRQEVRAALERWGDLIEFKEVENISADVAKLLAAGEVLGWVQGRSEFGPRALGHRSIVADPRPAENKEIINQMIKKREGYRPFAPAVLEERAREFFVLPDSQTDLPFMTFVVPVQENMRQTLGAVTHVDGTARIQTVSKDANRKFWELIHEFDRITGIPLLLNTSFNNNAEPIVDSVDDAVACFLTTGLHRLVVGPYVVSRSAPEDIRRIGRLSVVLPAYRKLVRRFARNEAKGETELWHGIESTRTKEFGNPQVRISSAMYDALCGVDNRRSLDDLMQSRLGTSDAILEELRELWRDRILLLRPARYINSRN